MDPDAASDHATTTAAIYATTTIYATATIHSTTTIHAAAAVHATATNVPTTAVATAANVWTDADPTMYPDTLCTKTGVTIQSPFPSNPWV